MTLVKNKKNECDHTPKNEMLKDDITFFRAGTEVFWLSYCLLLVTENYETSPENYIKSLNFNHATSRENYRISLYLF